VKHNHIFAHLDDDSRQRQPSNNPAAGLSPAILSFEFPSIQGVGSMGGRTNQYCRIILRIQRCTMTLLIIISTLSFLYTTLQFIYYTLIHILFSHSFNFFILVSCRIFKSLHEGATFLLLLLILPAPAEADDLSTMRI